MTQQEALDRLRRRGRDRGLAVFLGAGVSQGSGLPGWQELVARMYFSAVRGAQADDEEVYPNYLYAVADWYVGKHVEPLEITARKIRSFYPNDGEFMDRLRRTLYRRFLHRGSTPATLQAALDENATLQAIVKLCAPNAKRHRRARAVITYNYDDLVEMALPEGATASRWKQGEPVDRRQFLPVYHVHGYVPFRGVEPSQPGELVFTEEQYHEVSHSPYAWSNLVQMEYMSQNAGLMIGLSVTDPNMRRLLHAARRFPEQRPIFAFLPHPSIPRPTKDEIQQMHSAAMQRAERLHLVGVDPTEGQLADIDHTLTQLEKFDAEQQEGVLLDLGVQPIWFRKPSDIPDKVDYILS